MVVSPTPKTPEWPPRSAPRLFVAMALAQGAAINLDGNAAHYLGKVMRVGTGDIIILCDNITGEWACEVASVAKRCVTLTVTSKLREREPVPNFWLCAALLKKDRFDLVLEKATELGVAVIKPVITRRCVADKLNLTRAMTLVTEAAEQCARTALPAIEEPAKLEAFLRDWPKDRTLFFADEMAPDETGRDAAAVFALTHGPAALLIGPEGGFDDAERKLLRAHDNVSPISFGKRILRAETAAMAGTALWMGVKGDWRDGE